MDSLNNNINYTPILNIGYWTYFLKNLDISYWVKQSYTYKLNNPNPPEMDQKWGYQSNIDLNQIPTFYPLVNYINQVQSQIIKDPNIKICNMWINISHPGAYSSIHTHNKYNKITLLNSGVLYLKIPKNSGDIILYNPLSISNSHPYTPQEGEILIFNQHLPHSVEPNLSQEDRILIAFNFS